ncbi:MAG: helix-turn-helix transcriptional regulator [bacterium]|nr:helix-turn-helix transcriptional regulator [bacterium]
MASIVKTIPQRIKQARLEAGLTLLQLAERIHLSGAMSVARYESGQRRVSLEMLEHIAAATGKELSWFFRGPCSEEFQEDSSVRAAIELKLQQACQRLSTAGCRRLLEFADLLQARYWRSGPSVSDSAQDSLAAQESDGPAAQNVRSLAADSSIDYV